MAPSSRRHRSPRATIVARAPTKAARRRTRARRRKSRLRIAPRIAAKLWDWLGREATRAVREDPYLRPAFEALARGDWRALSEREALRHFVRAPRATMARHCRRVFGRGYVKVALDFRLDQARTLLRSTTTPVAAVAHAVGYPDPGGFYHAFRRRFGRSPRAQRQRALGYKPRRPWKSPADRP